MLTKKQEKKIEKLLKFCRKKGIIYYHFENGDDLYFIADFFLWKPEKVYYGMIREKTLRMSEKLDDKAIAIIEKFKDAKEKLTITKFVFNDYERVLLKPDNSTIYVNDNLLSIILDKEQKNKYRFEYFLSDNGNFVYITDYGTLVAVVCRIDDTIYTIHERSGEND